MEDQTKNLIQSHIDTNEVCLFMKGTPDAPQCGFSMAISNMLKILEVDYRGINVLENQSLRELYTILCCSILLFPENSLEITVAE